MRFKHYYIKKVNKNNKKYININNLFKQFLFYKNCFFFQYHLKYNKKLFNNFIMDKKIKVNFFNITKLLKATVKLPFFSFKKLGLIDKKTKKIVFNNKLKNMYNVHKFNKNYIIRSTIDSSITKPLLKEIPWSTSFLYLNNRFNNINIKLFFYKTLFLYKPTYNILKLFSKKKKVKNRKKNTNNKILHLNNNIQQYDILLKLLSFLLKKTKTSLQETFLSELYGIITERENKFLLLLENFNNTVRYTKHFRW